MRVSLTGADIDAVRIGPVHGDRAAGDADTREVSGIDVEGIHQRPPAGGAVVGPEDSAVRGCGIDDSSVADDGETGHAAADRLMSNGLPI